MLDVRDLVIFETDVFLKEGVGSRVVRPMHESVPQIKRAPTPRVFMFAHEARISPAWGSVVGRGPGLAPCTLSLVLPDERTATCVAS